MTSKCGKKIKVAQRGIAECVFTKYPYIYSRHMESIMFIILQIFLATHAQLGHIIHLTRLDRWRVSKNIRWIKILHKIILSFQDALSSIIVARDGFGDMAVSNAIGSNVFDINLGIGLPFVIRILIDNLEPIHLLTPAEEVNIEIFAF